MGIINHTTRFLDPNVFARNPEDRADIARELAGSNLINRTVSRFIPQDSPIQGLFSLQQWGFVGGMQLLGDIAGYAGRSLLAPYGLGLVGQIVFDEVATGIFTGALRGRENIGTHIGRDIGEGLATRLIILPISLLLGGSPLARFVLQPILFGAASYFVQRAGDLAFHEQTAPTSFTDHLLSSGVMMLQGQCWMGARHAAFSRFNRAENSSTPSNEISRANKINDNPANEAAHGIGQPNGLKFNGLPRLAIPDLPAGLRRTITLTPETPSFRFAVRQGESITVNANGNQYRFQGMGHGVIMMPVDDPSLGGYLHCSNSNLYSATRRGIGVLEEPNRVIRVDLLENQTLPRIDINGPYDPVEIKLMEGEDVTIAVHDSDQTLLYHMKQDWGICRIQRISENGKPLAAPFFINDHEGPESYIYGELFISPACQMEYGRFRIQRLSWPTMWNELVDVLPKDTSMLFWDDRRHLENVWKILTENPEFMKLVGEHSEDFWNIMFWHGSEIESVPGVAHARGLANLSSLIPNLPPFAGEIQEGSVRNGINLRAISFATSWLTAGTYARDRRVSSGWSLDASNRRLEYLRSEAAIKNFELSFGSLGEEIRNRQTELEILRQAAWERLPPEEQILVQQGGPVMYGVSQIGAVRFSDFELIRGAFGTFKDEHQLFEYHFPVGPAGDINAARLVAFCDEEQVEQVRGCFIQQGLDVNVYSIHTLNLFKRLHNCLSKLQFYRESARRHQDEQPEFQNIPQARYIDLPDRTLPDSVRETWEITEDRLDLTSYTRDDFLQHDLEFNADEIIRSIGSESFSPQDLLRIFAEDPVLRQLYQSDVGVSEGYTLAEHSVMVSQQYERYFSHIPFANNIDVSFMRLLSLTHDLGKPLVATVSHLRTQAEYNPDFVGHVFEASGVHQGYVVLARALVSADPIGEYMKGGDLDAAVRTIHNMRDQTECPMDIFFDMLRRLYMSDTSSYPNIRTLFMIDTENGSLRFNHAAEQYFLDLQNALF